MANSFYGATGLIGGTDGKLDNIDGADLADLDGAVVIANDIAYFYHLDGDSGAAESSPDIIEPDSNGGTKRWILDSITTANYEATNKLTAAATNAGEIDFTAASKKLDIEGNAVVDQDYSSDASPTFAGATLTDLTQGSIMFAGASSLISQDNPNLFWDDTNNRLGIGTAAPNAPLEVRDDFQGVVGGFPSGILHITNEGTDANDNAVITGHNRYSTNKQLWYLGSTSNANDNIAFINRQSGTLSFATNNVTRIIIDNAGLLTSLGASVAVGEANVTTGALILHDSNSANTITLTAPDISAGSLSFTLPPTDGDNTNVLQTDGNGVLTWVAATGTDEKIKVDAAATADYLGAASSDGVLRTGAGLAYADGGNFVTLTTVPLAGTVVQVVNTQTGAVDTGATVLPVDDTIPQNTEGDEYVTRAITPTNASNKLRIDVVINLSSSSVGAFYLTTALFQDSTANALAAVLQVSTSATYPYQMVLTHYMTAGTTSETTFKIRAGSNLSGTTTLNGISGGRIHGGIMASSMTITEIEV